MTERWLPVVGFEGRYEVSDQGNVRSVTRRVANGRGGTRLVVGRILVPYVGDYLKMKLGRYSSTKSVHILMAEAFIGPRPDGFEVCHNNGNPHDNRLENLRYDTAAGNAADRLKHGRQRNQYGKTHCKQGHEFTPENTFQAPTQRKCRICMKASYEKSRAKARA